MTSRLVAPPTPVRQNDDYMCWAAVLSSWTFTIPAGVWHYMTQDEIRSRVQNEMSGYVPPKLKEKGGLDIGDLQSLFRDRGLSYFGLAADLPNAIEPSYFYTLLQTRTRWPIFIGYKEPRSRNGFHANFVYGSSSDGTAIEVMEPRSGMTMTRSVGEYAGPYVIGYHFSPP